MHVHVEQMSDARRTATTVYLDGQKVADCIAADDEAGWVDVLDFPAMVAQTPGDDSTPTIRQHGTVRIETPPADDPAILAAEAAEDAEDLELARIALAEGGPNVSFDALKAELGL